MTDVLDGPIVNNKGIARLLQGDVSIELEHLNKREKISAHICLCLEPECITILIMILMISFHCQLDWI